jgi:hypothetical protein
MSRIVIVILIYNRHKRMKLVTFRYVAFTPESQLTAEVTFKSFPKVLFLTDAKLTGTELRWCVSSKATLSRPSWTPYFLQTAGGKRSDRKGK